MNKKVFNEIESYMLECVEESAHDKEHIYRVLNYCLYLAEGENNVDYDVLITAALLHDIARDGKRKDHAAVGSEMAKEYLSTIDFPKETTVREHRHSYLALGGAAFGVVCAFLLYRLFPRPLFLLPFHDFLPFHCGVLPVFVSETQSIGHQHDGTLCRGDGHFLLARQFDQTFQWMAFRYETHCQSVG